MVSYKTISGICGILSSVVIATGMSVAISLYPSFSWATNYVSHLGSEGVASEPFFNYGVMISAAFLFAFSFGLLKSLNNSIGKIGCVTMAGAAVGLAGLGIFNLPHELHLPFTVPFFLLVPISLLIIGFGFLLNNQKGLGRKTILTGTVTSIFAAATMIFSLMSLDGFAVFEALTSTVGGLWVIAISIMLIRKKI